MDMLITIKNPANYPVFRYQGVETFEDNQLVTLKEPIRYIVKNFDALKHEGMIEITFIPDNKVNNSFTEIIDINEVVNKPDSPYLIKDLMTDVFKEAYKKLLLQSLMSKKYDIVSKENICQ